MVFLYIINGAIIKNYYLNGVIANGTYLYAYNNAHYVNK